MVTPEPSNKITRYKNDKKVFEDNLLKLKYEVVYLKMLLL